MDKKIGFFGSGNMAEAVISGLLRSSVCIAEQLMAYDIDSEKLATINKQYKVLITNQTQELFQFADYVIIAVKPQIFPLLKETFISSAYKGIIISVMAGITIADLQNAFPEAEIVRTMPNTPALVGEGMTGIAYSDLLTKEHKDNIKEIFSSVGKYLIIKEEQLAAITGVSGSGPAYVYLFAEAMADAAVFCGLSRNDAYLLTAQTLAGSAKMLIETGKHPGELKDMVTSPGGTTIEAVKSLEANGFRHAVMEAVISSYKKSKQL